MHDQLDDAAAAALWALRGADKEHIALLYEQDGLQRTPFRTQGQENASRGTFRVPPGSLRALVHNHPRSGNPRNDQNISKFSPEDVRQAQQLGVPSYLQVGKELTRYVPNRRTRADNFERGQPVLAQIPIEQIRRLYLAQGLTK